MKNIKDLRELVLEEVELFIEENRDEFEFIVDLDDIDNWSFSEEDGCVSIDECCNVFVRLGDDLKIEEGYSDDDSFLKKVCNGDFVFYIVM